MPDVMPASRTNRPFFNVSEHLKTLIFIGISSFYLSHRISGGNMTCRQKGSRFGGISRAENPHTVNIDLMALTNNFIKNVKPRFSG